jgi:hypothetical protein
MADGLSASKKDGDYVGKFCYRTESNTEALRYKPEG